MNKFKRVVDILSRLFLLLLLIVIMAIVRGDAFFTWNNLSAVIFQQAPFTILMSFGMTLAIITKGIDNSMGSVMVLSSILSAGAFKSGNLVIGLIIALAVGILCGLVNGALISRVGITPFVATYGVDWVTLGVAYIITNGVYIYGFPDEFRSIANHLVFGAIPNIAIITVCIFLVLWFATKKTVFGRNLSSIGFNYNATVLSGVNAKNTLAIVYLINGLLAATSGILYTARLNAADPGIGLSFTLDSIAATLIGGTSFEGGKGSVANTVIGALIIVFIRNGMNILGVQTTWQQTVVGAVILFSVLYEAFINKVIRTSSPKKQSAAPETQAA